MVSHSRALADAAVRLASGMVQGSSLRIEVAAGLDETTLGTDAMAIADAVERADGPAGVVVLMDLGSAVLSAELALEMLSDPSVAERVTLSPAPIVEGLVVAAVAAAGGASRAEVAAEARDALAGKASQLAPADQGAATAQVSDRGDAGADDGAATAHVSERGDAAAAEPDAAVGVATVADPHGLHARPAAALVEAARGLEATVELCNLTTGAGPVPGTSLSRVATLGALHGHRVEVRATGPQAQEAVRRLVDLAEASGAAAPSASTPRASTTGASTRGQAPDDPTADMGGDVSTAGTRSAAGATDHDPAAPHLNVGVPGRATRGPLGASPGIAVGSSRRLTAAPVDLDQSPAGDPGQEWQRVEAAVATVRQAVEQLRQRTARDVGEEEAGIFDAHLSLLTDPELLADVRARTDAGGAAPAAWAAAVGEVEEQWAGLADEYLRQRAGDVRSVGDQVLRALAGDAAPQLREPGVLVARDLTPAEAAGLDLALVTGIVLAEGSPTSHAAILARARGIPLVVAAGGAVLTVPNGTPLALDGATGELHLDPSPELLATYAARAADLAARGASDLAAAAARAVTRDGVTVAVAANLGSQTDARTAAANGADAAGLVRTELLFLDRAAAPDAAEQQQVYDAIAEAMAGRPITLRTLDIGGDKPLPYVSMPQEANPFLGLRGLRFSLDEGRLLRDQLTAIVATARRHPVGVMFPMVSTPEELLAARAVLEEVAGPAGLPAGLRVGTMVEVPAAALKTAAFLPSVDFLSIGTNDLTQYTLAAERGNGGVAALFDPLDPGVLRLVDHVCRAAGDAVEVAVCGEAAADEVAVPVLVGLGVRELSVSPTAIPRVKAVVRELDAARCADLARRALELGSAAEVRALVAADRA